MKMQFTYNEETDSYTCPGGQELTFSCILKRKGKPDIRVYRAPDCLSCPLKERCTKARRRSICRDPREYLPEAMRKNLETEKGKQMKKDRHTKVESPFGNSKYNKKFTQFLMRGKQYAAVEFTFLCIALNIEKIYMYTRAHSIDLKAALGADGSVDHFVLCTRRISQKVC